MASLLALFIAIRLIISTDGYPAFKVFFGSIDYEQMTLFICLSTFLIKLAALMFYTESLNLKIGKSTFIGLCLLFMICVALLTFFPYMVCTPYYYILIQTATLPLDIVVLGRLADSVARKVPYALIYSSGYIAMIAGIMVDCFYTNGLIQLIASSFMPFCFGFLVAALSAVLAEKQSELYREALKSAELDRELVKANTSIMISQIQPHFMYNALNTIKVLTKRDPKTAEKAIISFSSYLRGNMDSLTNNEPIPFITEIYHVKNYCDIELLRFGDRLKVVYDTSSTEFTIPALTIQPIVENAIKHGVMKKPEGGTVTISSYEDAYNYIITVIDDGVGFDPDNIDMSYDSQHAHVGIQNVSNRLKSMMNASLDIQSTPENGTYVTIKIPKEKG